MIELKAKIELFEDFTNSLEAQPKDPTDKNQNAIIINNVVGKDRKPTGNILNSESYLGELQAVFTSSDIAINIQGHDIYYKEIYNPYGNANLAKTLSIIQPYESYAFDLIDYPNISIHYTFGDGTNTIFISLDIDKTYGVPSYINYERMFVNIALYKTEYFNYFVSNSLSDENGNFTKPYKFSIGAPNIVGGVNNFTICFDTINNSHPRNILVNGENFNVAQNFNVDSPTKFILLNYRFQDFIEIEIPNWTKPNHPVVITSIYNGADIEINRKNIIGVEGSILDRSDLKLPSYGVISNTGKLEFNDTDGKIRDYAEQLLLEKGLECKIILENTLVKGATETIGTFETNEWDYENDNRVVSVSLKDDLEEWQEINVEAIDYDPRNPVAKPFSWLYNYLLEITTKNEHYKMFSLSELDEETQRILNNTYIQYPLLKAGNLWQEWTKLCEACQMHIYKNSNGVVVCRYNGGN